jgi:hypothetical protein
MVARRPLGCRDRQHQAVTFAITLCVLRSQSERAVIAIATLAISSAQEAQRSRQGAARLRDAPLTEGLAITRLMSRFGNALQPPSPGLQAPAFGIADPRSCRPAVARLCTNESHRMR